MFYAVRLFAQWVVWSSKLALGLWLCALPLIVPSATAASSAPPSEDLSPDNTTPSDLPKIQIGAADWKPYFYGGRQDGPPGSAVEILEICIPKLGYQPEFIPSTVDEVFAGLKSGNLQLHVLSFRPERAEYLSYAEEPMFYSGYRPFVRPGIVLDGYRHEALDDLRLGHRREMKYSAEFDAYMKRRMEKDDVLVVDSDPDALKAVAEGKVDAVPLMLSTALHHRRRLGLEDQVNVLMDFDLKTAGYRVAVPKIQTIIQDVPSFLAGIDRCIKDLKADGRYDEIGDRYVELIE